MIAYFVHDGKKQEDRIVLPEMGCSVSVDAKRFEAFISVGPVFAEWSGDSCADLTPEDFGKVVATREEGGDVCIADDALWRERMAAYSVRS